MQNPIRIPADRTVAPAGSYTPVIQTGPLQLLGFRCALILVFLRFSYLHETITFLTGVNTYVLYLFTPFALLGVIACGGLYRTFREWPAKFWLGFLLWMILAIPFSSWPGGSFEVFFVYLRTDVPMLLVISGVVTTWAQCKKVMWAIAIAAMFNLATARLFTRYTSSDRLSLQWAGAIGNSNDLAAHLLLVLPVVLFFALRTKTLGVVRIGLFGVVAYGIFEILHTGSRGALLALLLTFLYVLVRGTPRQRVAVALAPVGLILMVAFLPGSTWQRLTSFSENDSATEEAIESTQARQYLLKQSIIYTFQKPFFGIGPGQFSSYEGTTMKELGLQGNWHETHNTYTEVSSECGIPALAFYLAAIFTTFGLLAKTRKLARAKGDEEVVTAVFCLTIALVAYCIAAMFVNFAYKFYLPAMSSLVIAVWQVVSREAKAPPGAPPAWQADHRPIRAGSMG